MPIPADLFPGRSQERIVVCAFYFDHAAFRRLALLRLAPLHLFRSVQAEIGMPGALIGQFADAKHFRFERVADGVEQIRQRAVARPLTGSAARRADLPQVAQIGFNRGGQACRCRCHGRLEWPRDIGLRFAHPTYRTPSNRESPQPAWLPRVSTPSPREGVKRSKTPSPRGRGLG